MSLEVYFNQILSHYNSIWERYDSSSFSDILERGFVFQYDEDEKECELLFVGINPAYKLGDPKERIGISRLQTDFPYFKPFKDITKEVNSRYNKSLNWTHIDLLAFRETKQDFITKNLLKAENGPEFIMEQLRFALKRIKRINPKVIIVSNALARTFLGMDKVNLENGIVRNEWLGLEFSFDENLGTHRLANLSDTPVFFTSMLSGQRALDKGSRERLIWHINKVV